MNFRNDNVEDLYREVRSENSSNFSIRFLSESLEMTNKSHPELISGSHKVEDEKLKKVQLDRELKKILRQAQNDNFINVIPTKGGI